MAIHTDDLLEKLDRVLAQPWLPPAAQCGRCGNPLTGREASLDFCADECQYVWHYSQTEGRMPDGGMGMDTEIINCLCSACATGSNDRELWVAAGLGRSYDHHLAFIHAERGRRERGRRNYIQAMTQARVITDYSIDFTPSNPPMSWRARMAELVFRFAGVDPDS